MARRRTDLRTGDRRRHLSPLVERWSAADLARLGSPLVLAALGYPKAGMYAFVSPLVALILGRLFFDESLSAGKLLGAAITIASSATVMTQRSTVR